MIKHTKGPWNEKAISKVLRYASKSDGPWNNEEIWPEDDSLNMPDYYGGDPGLIAAAPTMYESLTKVFELANDSNTNPHELLAKISQIAEAGIKEAEGK